MKMRAQEMRVVSSYGPNITLKVLQRRSLKYWAKGKKFWFFYLQFYVVSYEVIFLAQYFKFLYEQKL